MSDQITASFDTLLQQATQTSAQYLRHAKRDIDELFGDGYAAKNPSLVAAYMQTAAADFSSSTQGKILGASMNTMSDAINTLSNSVDGIAESISNVATSLEQ
ncbi:MAG: hypothetical protein EOO23_08930 [Comamonadaceae bacterium]|nr:MAG: hypothetical protein EOO23_08930 [Comamonadaceae bacterium]